MRCNRLHPCLRYPWSTLLLAGLVSGWTVRVWLGTEISAETGTLLEGDRRSHAIYQKARQMLGRDVVLLVSVDCGDVFSAQGMARIRRMSEAFLKQAGVLDVKSFTHAVKPVRRGWSFEMVPLVSEAPSAAELETLRAYSMGNPLIRNVMMSGDAREASLLVTYNRRLHAAGEQTAFRQEIDAILAPFRAEGVQCLALAVPLIEEEIRSTLRHDLRWMIPAALGILTLVLRLTFGSWRMVVLVAGVQGLTLLAVPWVVRSLGCQLNLFSTMLFPLLAAIHLALLVHLLTAWQDALKAPASPDTAVARALGVVFRPSAFSVLTTGIGLASLVVSDVRLVREFGLLGVAGVSLVFAVTYGPVVALLQLLSRGSRIRFARRREGTIAEDLGTWLAAFCGQRRRPILITSLVAAAGGVAGWTQLRTDASAVEFLHPESETRKAVERVDAAYGGVNVVQIEVDTGRPDGVQDRRILEYLRDVEAFAAAQPGVSGAYSFGQLIALMNQLWEGEATGSFRLPAQPWTLNLFAIALKSYGAPFLAALTDDEWRKAYVIVRTPNMPAGVYLETLQAIEAYAWAHKPPGVGISAAEGIHTLLDADRRILRSQTDSAFIAVLGMGIALALLLGSWRLALLAMAVNVIAVGAVAGAAGWSGATLNSVTVMAAAVCLGIAVDDAVHLLLRWRAERQKGSPPVVALEASLRAKARPILGSNLVLLGVFGVLLLSTFPPVAWFGGLAVASFVAASLTVLFLLPVFIRGRTA